jgi:hypothetical protein
MLLITDIDTYSRTPKNAIADSGMTAIVHTKKTMYKININSNKIHKYYK